MGTVCEAVNLLSLDHLNHYFLLKLFPGYDLLFSGFIRLCRGVTTASCIRLT